MILLFLPLYIILHVLKKTTGFGINLHTGTCYPNGAICYLGPYNGVNY